MQTSSQEQPKPKFEARAWISKDLNILKRATRLNPAKEVKEATHWLEKLQQALQAQ